MVDGESRWKLAIHGPVVDLRSTVWALNESIDVLLGQFAVPGWPERFRSINAVVHPFEDSEVLPRLPQNATPIGRTSDSMDVYEDDDRYWIVDDRWGMCEIDISNNTFHSWVVASPKIDALRVAELAVMWPLAQLLRSRGLHLIQAVSAVRDGFAWLMICPFPIEPELTSMISSGYKIIGQRWTALREEDGRVALLQMPGKTERLTMPRMRVAGDELAAYVDVTSDHPGSRQHHAFCDAVFVVDHGRRPLALMRDVPGSDSAQLVRDAWPISELHAARRANPMPGIVAEHCPVYSLQLSRITKDMLALVNSARFGRSQKSVAA